MLVDDVKPEVAPDSDDTITSGGISPRVVVSPIMLPGEAGSDESTESPLKAHMDRKKRLQASKSRSALFQGVTCDTGGSDALKSGPPAPSQTRLVDIQARQAMMAACQLMPSMDEVGLAKMSSFLEQMHAKVQNELKRKSESS